MTTYHVYVSARQGGEAIREGFSWPGFLLTWIWAFDKRLWKTGLGLLFMQLALIGLVYAGRVNDAPRWVIAALLVDSLSRLFVGLQGSYWRENSMDRRGFAFEASVQAATAGAAIERALPGGAAATLAPQDIAWRMPRALPGLVGAALVLAILGAVWSWLREPEPVAGRPTDGPANIAEPAVAGPAGEQGLASSALRGGQQPAPDIARSPPERPPGWTLPPTRAPTGPEMNRPVTNAAPGGQVSATPGDTSSGRSMPPPAGGDAGGDRSQAAMESAWLRYFQPSANCVNPADWDTYVECTNQEIRERQAFEQKWSAGQLH